MNLDSVPLWCALFFLYLNFINASGKRCVPFVPYLRVEQCQDSFYQTYIFYWSLIPTGSCLWFLKIWTLSTKVKTEIWSVFAILKLYQWEWNRIKSLFNIPKLLQVIDPYQIMSMEFKNDTEMWSAFSILKPSQKEWKARWSICSIPKLY